MTLGTLIRRRLVVAAIIFAAPAAWLAGGEIGAATGLNGGGSHGASFERPTATGSTAWLIERHDCWTGAAPADMRGKIPGHVVVTLPGATAPTYGGARLVGQALEQVFNGVERGLDVHAFCR